MLIHRADQLTADIVSLSCHSCKTRFAIDDVEDAGFRCPDCGTGGFVAHKASRMSERFPEPLVNQFTPIPEALMDHAPALGIGPHELLIIMALERHRRVMGDVVFPGQDRLATLTRLSIHQVRRGLRSLIAANLIIRHDQPGQRGSGGRSRVQYDLDPLWNRLAAVAGHPCSPTVGEQGRTPTPEEEAPTEVGAHRCTEVGVQNDAGWCAESTPEVDVEVDVDLEGEPDGTSVAPRPLAAIESPAVEEAEDLEAERWATFEAWWTQHPGITNVTTAWRRWQAENNHIEEAAA